jgi:Flp pilus assembly protein TadD
MERPLATNHEPVNANLKSKDREKIFVLCVLLLVLVGWTFFTATENNFINFDDPLYVTANAHVQQGSTWENVRWAFCSATAGLWHPLTLLSHMLDVQLYGLKPGGHHLTNVLFHAANTILVFLILRRMTGTTEQSFFVAALFGVHPLHVESVAWVSERKDVLSTFFWLLTTWAYARYVEEPKFQKRAAIFFYTLALLLFCLGLMAKPMLVTLPCVLLLLDYWPLKRWESKGTRYLITEKVPFFLLAAVASAATVLIQKGANTVVSLAALPWSARVGNAFVSYARYLGKLFCPINLSVFYPYPDHWPLVTVTLAIALCIAISLLAILRRRQQPYLLVGWLWFLGTLVPVIGLLQVGEQSMADRYTYIPLVGLSVFFVWGMFALTQQQGRRQAFIPSIFATAAIISCAILAHEQVGQWKSSETLFRHAIAVTKNNYVAHGLLGDALTREKRFDEAIEQLQEASRLNPNDAKLHYRLGTGLENKGQLDGAINQYRETIKLDPNCVDAYNKLGMALGRKGLLDEAIQQFQAALKLAPGFNDLHYNLGNALARTGRLSGAAEQFQEALKLKPDDAGAHNNLGVVLSRQGRIAEAIVQFQEALELKPDYSEARKNLAAARELKTPAPTH